MSLHPRNLAGRRAASWGLTWALGVSLLESLQLPLDHWSVGEIFAWVAYWIGPLWCGASGMGIALLLLVNRAERRGGRPAIVAAYFAICPLAGLLQAPLARALLSLTHTLPVSQPYGSPLRPWDAGGLWHTWEFMFYGAILVVAYVATIRAERTHHLLHESRMARSRVEGLLDAERLRALQAQIDPTLLLGTMRELEARYRGDPVHAERLLETLVEFLRYAMQGLRTANSTVGAELKLARAFATLQFERGLTDAWRVSDEAPASIDAMPFPSLLMLQLLALGGSGGRPMLRATQTQGVIRLTLLGLALEFPSHLRQQIETQLAVMYPSGYRLLYAASDPSQLTFVLQPPTVS